MSSNIIGPLPKKSVSPSEKIKKSSGNLDDVEDPVVIICQKDLYNKKERENNNKYHFQGKSVRSKLWFDIDHEWLEEKFFTWEPDFYTKLYKMNIKGQEMETYQIFFVPMGNTNITEKPEISYPKNSETPINNIEKSRDDLDDKEAHKD